MNLALWIWVAWLTQLMRYLSLCHTVYVSSSKFFHFVSMCVRWLILLKHRVLIFNFMSHRESFFERDWKVSKSSTSLFENIREFFFRFFNILIRVWNYSKSFADPLLFYGFRFEVEVVSVCRWLEWNFLVRTSIDLSVFRYFSCFEVFCWEFWSMLSWDLICINIYQIFELWRHCRRSLLFLLAKFYDFVFCFFLIS